MIKKATQSGGGGTITVGTFGSSPNADGASASGSTITLQPADATHPGLLTTGAQSIAGAKTFTGAISASNLSGTNTGDVWTLAKKPATPHAADDEFETTNLTGWSTSAGYLSGTAVNPYNTDATANGWRGNHNSMRPSWMLIQPSTGAYVNTIYKAVTINTDQMVMARINFNYRGGAGAAPGINADSTIGLFMTRIVAGAPDGVNFAGVYINISDSGVMAAQASMTGQSGINAIFNYASHALEYVLIQKISAQYYFWVGSASGNWIHVGTYAYGGSALNGVSIVAANNSGAAPGNMIMGVDFVRFYDGIKLP